MPAETWLETLFASIDRKDADGFAGHLAEDVEFQFGNLPVVKGNPAVAAFVTAFFDSIRGLSHEIIEHWVAGDGTIVCRGVVTYERHDGSRLAVPFANIMKRSGERASEYRIYGDASALHQS